MRAAPPTKPKPLTFSILRLLSDGEFHSGEDMAQRLGVSRATVHNALQDVEVFGIKLHSVRGRGYQLGTRLYWLDAGAIGAELGEAHAALQIELFDHAPSSNAMLMQRAALGAASGSVVVLELQSAGRGRLGRAWHSGLGDALTFSLLWRFECGLAALSGLSLAVGVAVVRALHELGVPGAGLKWPNDVLLGRGKLAGILLEAQGDMLGPSAVVIGIGLNLTKPKQAENKIGQPVGDLATYGVTAQDRNRVLALLLKHLVMILREFTSHGFAGLRAEWESCHVFQQRAARLLLPDGTSVEGEVQGVTDEGALRLLSHAGERIFNAGEISLRSI